MPCIDFEQVVKPDVEYTVALIKQLHAGQTDQAGKPYVNHPRRVAQNSEDFSRIAAMTEMV